MQSDTDMDPARPLWITWILKCADLSGGVRVVRQLSDQLHGFGHRCTIAFLSESMDWPAPWRVRTWTRRVMLERSNRGHERHHLEGSPHELIEVKGPHIEAADVPDADVVIGTWWETMEWTASWPREKGARAYFIQHHEVFGGEPRRVQATYRLPALKLTVSRWLRDLMRDVYGDPHAVLVPNSIDPQQFEAPPRNRSDPPTVGVMTSRTQWKRTDLAFEAIRLAQQSEPRLRVIAFGSEPLGRELRRPRGLEFVQRPAQHEIASLYARCDAWLVASDSEGFGLPGLEAAACRCPVIATRCGGPEEYVRDGRSGFLVPRGDAVSMARRIVELVSSKDEQWRRISDESYRMAQRFSWPRSARRLERALRQRRDPGGGATPARALSPTFGHPGELGGRKSPPPV